MLDYYTSPEALESEGIVMYSVNSKRTVQDIFDTILAPIIMEPEFESICKSVESIIEIPKREVMVYVMSEKIFHKFCLFASRSSFVSPDGKHKERCIMFNLLYTDHDEFKFKDIPVYRNEKLVSACKYMPNNVYSIRIVSEENSNDDKTCSEDIIVYIPSRVLNCMHRGK